MLINETTGIKASIKLGFFISRVAVVIFFLLSWLASVLWCNDYYIA